MRWSMRLESREAVVRAYLARDRDWTAYMLGDLDPASRPFARFYLAAAGGVDRAAALIYAPPEFTAIVTAGAAAGVAALLAAIPALPTEAALIAPPDHRMVLEQRYAAVEWEPMLRMALGVADWRAPDAPGPVGRLDSADLADIQALLAARDFFAPFTPAMLEQGVYYGVRENGRLLAVAGTHVVSPASRVAAVGNVYTAPAARRRGYAMLTTAAVVRDLLATGCERVVLNVRSDNQTAIGVYRRLGFQEAGPFWEAPRARRRD